MTSHGVPDPSFGRNSDWCIDKDNLIIYGPKTAGDWGDGESLGGGGGGGSGSSIRFGSGLPNNASGVNGDVYIRTNATMDIYQKQSGTYVQEGSLVGPSGQDGEDGSPGTPGAPGTPGTQIRTGSTVPSNGTGVDGDLYIRTNATTDWFKRIAGSYVQQGSLQGTPGEDGDPGSPGTPGTQIRTGSTVPDNAVGVDGDLYFRTNTTQDWFKRVAGSYVQQGSLKGADGSSGIDQANFQHWRKGKADVLLGLSETEILFQGDSTMAGIGPSFSGLITQTPAAYLRSLMSSLIPTREGVIIPWGGTDSRITFGASWSIVDNGVWTNGAASPDAITFVSDVESDTVVIYWAHGFNDSTVNVTIDGVSKTPITTVSGQNVADYCQKTTYGGLAKGRHTVVIQPTGVSYFVYQGIEFYDSSKKAVKFSNISKGSTRVQDWLSDQYGFNAKYLATNNAHTFSPSLVVIDLTINDAGITDPPTDVDTYKTNLTQLIHNWKDRGIDVLILTGNPFSTYDDNQPTITDAALEVAKENDCNWVDVYSRFGKSGSNPFGDAHLSPDGYLDIASAMCDAVMEKGSWQIPEVVGDRFGFRGSLEATQYKLSAIRRQDTSVGNLHMMCGPGDSITQGLDASSTLKSYPGWLVKRLNDNGIPAILSPIIFMGNEIPIVEPRLGSIPSGWHVGAFDPHLDGIQTTGDGVANGHAITCTPDYEFDTFDIFWTRLGPDLSADVQVDGVSVGSIGAGGNSAGQGQKSSFTCTLGTHTISVIPSNTDANKFLSLTAFDAWDSSTPCVKVFNVGRSGTKVSDWLSYGSTYSAQLSSPTQMIPGQWTPDLHVVMLGANDIGADEGSATDLTQYKTDYTSLVTNLVAHTDVFMASSNTALGNDARAVPYNDVARFIAKTFGLGYMSVPERWGPIQEAHDRGWMDSSSHPNDVGYEDYEDGFYFWIFLGTGQSNVGPPGQNGIDGTDGTDGTDGVDATPLADIMFSIDNNGDVLPTGVIGYLPIDFNCTINSATLIADQSGSVVVDVLKSTYSGYPTMTSICASAKPTLSSAAKSKDTTLTGWTTSISAGDILKFSIGSVSTITRLTLALKVTKTS